MGKTEVAIKSAIYSRCTLRRSFVTDSGFDYRTASGRNSLSIAANPVVRILEGSPCCESIIYADSCGRIGWNDRVVQSRPVGGVARLKKSASASNDLGYWRRCLDPDESQRNRSNGKHCHARTAVSVMVREQSKADLLQMGKKRCLAQLALRRHVMILNCNSSAAPQ